MGKECCLNCSVRKKLKEGRFDMTKKEFQKWIETENQKLAEERQQRMKEMGFVELLRLPIGESILTFQPEEPRTVNTKYGERKVFKVMIWKNGQVEDKTYDFMINEKSPLYRSIISQLANGNNTITIVRSGEGKATRYSVKK
jgi:hypothetical protein